jgi:hypothetical protein
MSLAEYCIINVARCYRPTAKRRRLFNPVEQFELAIEACGD